jgi:hypothetical protein
MFVPFLRHWYRRPRGVVLLTDTVKVAAWPAFTGAACGSSC